MANSYRELEIYQLAHQLGVDIHRFSLTLPKFELYEAGSQLRRAAKSISANIVEGYGRRRYKADFVRFLVYAQGSCDEATEWMKYVGECHEQPWQPQALLFGQRQEDLGRKLNSFIQSVELYHRT